MLFVKWLFEEKGVKWINREEDVADLGLRGAKSSYHPDLLFTLICRYEKKKFLCCLQGKNCIVSSARRTVTERYRFKVQPEPRHAVN